MSASNRLRRAGILHAAPLLTFLVLVPVAHAQGSNWPRQFDSTSGTFIVYQPQPEVLKGDTVTARAAFSLQKSDSVAATFGVLWFQARVQVDRDSNTVTESDLDVTKVRLPGAPIAEAKRYEHLVEAEATGWDLAGSLRELQAGLAASARERLSIENLGHAPPHVLFSTRRALLVSYDGKPQLEPIEGARLQRVANTPYAVVFDPGSGAYFLNGANLWYQARDPLGPWSVLASPPAEVAAVVPPDTSAADLVSGAPPVVITATEPTELIVTDGEPLLAPLVGSRLFYVTNTENDLLRDAKTGTVYALLAGRWFTARTLDDPWVYVPADSLPEVFAQIPPGSPKGNLLASVAGTEAADDAVADNQIPQTSSIARDGHDVAVEWDGQPQFEAIENTGLQFGVNTDAQIVAYGARYYLCDQGIWFVADDPNGPWNVSDVRPFGLDDLDPDCPVYNLRFVDIYGVTPDAVTAGYLPGYLGYYPCRGTVVYGTGYQYRAWRGRRYFPRPCTWGYDARYNPWLSRWSFGFSYSAGFMHIGLRWRSGPRPDRPLGPPQWLGPGGYHRPLLAEDRTVLRTRPVRARPRVSDTAPANLYSRSANARRLVKPGARGPRLNGAGRPARRPDNVFAGSDGRVYQRDSEGQWMVNRGGQWVITPMPVQSPPPVVPVGSGGTAGMRDNGRRPGVLPVTAPVTPAQPSLSPGAPTAPAQPRTERPAEPAPSTSRGSRPPAPVASPPVQPRPEPQPGGLERDFRARERAGSPPPAVAPAAPAPERPSAAPAPAPAPAKAEPTKAPAKPAAEAGNKKDDHPGRE